MRRLPYLILLLVGLTAFGHPSLAQESGTPRTVHIIYSHDYYYEDTPAGRKEFLGGEVRLRHDSTFLFCDTAYLFGPTVDALGNTSIVQGDSLRIYADTLTYDSHTGVAILIGRVLLENGNQRLMTSRLNYDTRARIGYYGEGAWLEHDDTRIYSRRGTYLVSDQLVQFLDSVQIQSPDFRLKADSMRYSIQDDRAIFTGPTRIRQENAQLYCEAGFYALGDGYGWFEKDAQFADSSRRATADRIYYNRTSGEIRLVGQADYQEGERQATGDSLYYHESTGEFLVRGNAFLKDGTQTIEADGVDYNVRTEQFRTTGRASIRDGAQWLTADRVENRDTSGIVLVEGHVLWRDTSAFITLQCDSALYHRPTGYLQAMGQPPLLIQVIEGDTLFLVADQIIAREDTGAIAGRTIRAFRNVFVYKSDLQAICDSLALVEKDSMFYFYQDPVVWSEDTTQFTADTLLIRMSDNKLDSIFLLRQSMIVTSPDGQHFNQIKGRYITGAFRDNAIRRMDVNGNAEAIYYAQDEDFAFIGVNQSACSDMVLFFEDNQVKDIFYLKEPRSSMTPMGQVDHGSLRLEGFKWRDMDRPLSLPDIRTRWVIAAGMAVKEEKEAEEWH